MISSGCPKQWLYSSLKGKQPPCRYCLLNLFQPACERDAATCNEDEARLCYSDQGCVADYYQDIYRPSQ